MAETRIQWINDLEEALTRARDQRRNVLVDFTAAPM